VDRGVLERYLAHLHAELGGRVVHRNMICQLNVFVTAIGQHGWGDALPVNAMFFSEDFPKDAQWLPRALSDRVMAQLEHLDNLGRWNNPGHRRASQRARAPGHGMRGPLDRRWRPGGPGRHPVMRCRSNGAGNCSACGREARRVGLSPG
jgi:hypothetical protein